jgi:formate-dependent phosphoribosylglycinamide formyltransferase (GAR transformylase)
MPVLAATTLMTDRLLAIEEHACNFGAVLPAARAVREQIDWDEVRAAVKDNPYGSAFLYLLDRLAITA